MIKLYIHRDRAGRWLARRWEEWAELGPWGIDGKRDPRDPDTMIMPGRWSASDDIGGLRPPWRRYRQIKTLDTVEGILAALPAADVIHVTLAGGESPALDWYGTGTPDQQAEALDRLPAVIAEVRAILEGGRDV